MTPNTPPSDTGYITFDRLSLFAPNPKGHQLQRPRMSFGIDPKGSPMITVAVNDPDLQGRMGFINAIYTPKEFMNVVETFHYVLNNPEPSRMTYQTFRQLRDSEGNPIDGKGLLVALHVCKDKEGMVWMALDQEGKPKIKFTFEFAEWHTLVNQEGQPVDAGTMSQIVARATIEALRDMGKSAVMNRTARQQKVQQMQSLGARPADIGGEDITF